MAGMTPEQKAEFLRVLGKDDEQPLVWDELQVSIKRLLVLAAGVEQRRAFSPWSIIPEGDRNALNRAAAELIEWAEFTRQRMAQKPEGAAA